MTRYEKIAISLPLRAAEHARRAVKQGRATSVSAYVADAIELKAKTESLGEFLQDMLALTGGPSTAAERREARRSLGLGPKKSKKRR